MYTWDFDPEAKEQLDGSPAECSEALMAFLDALVLDPWDFGRTPEEPVGKWHRTLPFGAGLGLVSFLVLDHLDEVWVTRVNWLG